MIYIPDNGEQNDGFGTVAFAENYDSGFQMKIDGVVKLYDPGWIDNDVHVVRLNLRAGYHVFDLRVSNDGYGPNPNNPDGWGGDDPLGFTIDFTDPIATSGWADGFTRADWTKPDAATWVSPDGTPNKLFVTEAHEAGKRRDEFDTYLMYSPGGPGDSWVPLRGIHWHWAGQWELDYNKAAGERPYTMKRGFPMINDHLPDYTDLPLGPQRWPEWHAVVPGLNPQPDADQITTIADTPIPMG